MLAFQTLFEELRFGYGAALSMLLFAVTSLLAFLYIRLIGAELWRDGDEKHDERWGDAQ